MIFANRKLICLRFLRFEFELHSAETRNDYLSELSCRCHWRETFLVLPGWWLVDVADVWLQPVMLLFSEVLLSLDCVPSMWHKLLPQWCGETALFTRTHSLAWTGCSEPAWLPATYFSISGVRQAFAQQRALMDTYCCSMFAIALVMAAVVVLLLTVSLLWQRIRGFLIKSPLEGLRPVLWSCDFLWFPQMPARCCMSLLYLVHLTYKHTYLCGVCVRATPLLCCQAPSARGMAYFVVEWQWAHWQGRWMPHPQSCLFVYLPCLPLLWQGGESASILAVAPPSSTAYCGIFQ